MLYSLNFAWKGNLLPTLKQLLEKCIILELNRKCANGQFDYNY
jgi:hypothetical protein